MSEMAETAVTVIIGGGTLWAIMAMIDGRWAFWKD